MKKKSKKKRRCLICERVITKKLAYAHNPYICKRCIGVDEE